MNRAERIIYNFAEYVMMLPMFEMASNRNDAMNKVKGLSKTLNTHLFKYYLMPNDNYNREHWGKEIDNFLGDIASYKWKKKTNFDEDEYYNWLYLDFVENISNVKRIIRNVVDDYKDEYHIKYNVEEFVDMLEIFYKKISYLLSIDKYDYEELEDILKVFDIE